MNVPIFIGKAIFRDRDPYAALDDAIARCVRAERETAGTSERTARYTVRHAVITRAATLVAADCESELALEQQLKEARETLAHATRRLWRKAMDGRTLPRVRRPDVAGKASAHA